MIMALYHDATVSIDVPQKPATKGHLAVAFAPRDFASGSAEDFAELLSAASFCSNALFEALGAHGTNIIVTEDAQGVRADVLARMEGDGIDLRWTPMQLLPQEMDDLAARVKDRCDYIGAEKKPAKKPVAPRPSAESMEAEPADDEGPGKRAKNYLVRQLERIP